MNRIESKVAAQTEAELEQLFRYASPRPIPDDAEEAVVRRAVHAEWEKVAGRQKRQQRFVRFSVAASILVAGLLVSSLFRPTEVDVVQVAVIQKSFGSVHFLGDQSEWIRTDDLTAVTLGQTILTGDDAGIALAWGNGGSLRLDKKTEVEFRDSRSIYLRSGQVYFDSQPSELISVTGHVDVERFSIETEQGSVSHVGTQFMTSLLVPDALTVSVREGQVVVDGRYFKQSASSGEQLVFEGRQRPATYSVDTFGERWAWVGDTSPEVDVDGKPIDTFLNWVCRELGYSLEYANDDVERLARKETLKGRIDTGPADALTLRMLSTGLEWRIGEEGVIYVGNSE